MVTDRAGVSATRARDGDDPVSVALRRSRRDHALGARPWLMGIVNATPDSFSDGGRHPTLEARVALARELVGAGARRDRHRRRVGRHEPPGRRGGGGDRARRAADRTGRRRARRARSPSTPTSPRSPTAAIAAGASIVNDVSGLRDVGLADVCARHRRRARRDAHARRRPSSASRTPTSTATSSARCIAFLRRADRARALARRRRRAADRRSRAGLRQDAGADDRRCCAAPPGCTSSGARC